MAGSSGSAVGRVIVTNFCESGTSTPPPHVAGSAAFTQVVTSPLPAADQVLTATATNRLTGDTSEVSAPVTVDAAGQLGFAQPAYTVNEGESVTITVLRTGGAEGTVTVNYATENGSAIAPGDYPATSGTLTFGPGVLVQSIVIRPSPTPSARVRRRSTCASPHRPAAPSSAPRSRP